MNETMRILFDIYKGFTVFGVTFISFISIVRWNQHIKHMMDFQIRDTSRYIATHLEKLLLSMKDDKQASVEDD